MKFKILGKNKPNGRGDSHGVKRCQAYLRSSIQAVEKSISNEIEGNNQLEMVDKFNEIKVRYDELFVLYESLVLQNAETTKESVSGLLAADVKVGDNIKKGLG